MTPPGEVDTPIGPAPKPEPINLGDGIAPCGCPITELTARLPAEARARILARRPDKADEHPAPQARRFHVLDDHSDWQEVPLPPLVRPR